MMGKWTEEEIKFLKENYRELESKEIAKKLNRSISSIRNKLFYLDINKKKWTKKEIEFLQEHIENTDKYLAKKLNRSIKSIKRKKHGMKLKDYTILTASEVGRILKVDAKTITRWKVLGLKMKKNNPEKISSPFRIKIDELIKFLKANQDLWNASKLDLYALGIEPKWLVEKRKKDYKKIQFRNWTKEEDARLIFLRNQDKSCIEIGKELGRTKDAVSKRYCKLYYERKKKGEINAI